MVWQRPRSGSSSRSPLTWPAGRSSGAERNDLADALVAELESLGGELRTSTAVRSLAELPPARAILLDVTPRQAVAIADDRLRRPLPSRPPAVPVRAGGLQGRLGPLGPIPGAAPELGRAGTVHLGGRLADVVAAERAVHRGRLADAPFVLLVQASRFDKSRAPQGRHTAWAYCHVPPARRST